MSILSRRAFLRRGSLFLAAATAGGTLGCLSNSRNFGGIDCLRVGLLTDIHYADRDANGTRHYRDSPAKIFECVNWFNDRDVDFTVELGDFIDSAPSVEEEIVYLRTIDEVYGKLRKDRHYVLGNHCVQHLDKAQFLNHTGSAGAYYSFDKDRFHFVILDACYRQDGTPYAAGNFEWTDTFIPDAELEWLRADLAGTSDRVIVFVHQRLDETGQHSVKNNAAVRAVLEESGKVMAVFQGHNHKNDVQEIGGIHYCTLAAMVEGAGPLNNAYAMLNVFGDGSIRVDGFRLQSDYDWKAEAVGV